MRLGPRRRSLTNPSSPSRSAICTRSSSCRSSRSAAAASSACATRGSKLVCDRERAPCFIAASFCACSRHAARCAACFACRVSSAASSRADSARARRRRLGRRHRRLGLPVTRRARRPRRGRLPRALCGALGAAAATLGAASATAAAAASCGTPRRCSRASEPARAASSAVRAACSAATSFCSVSSCFAAAVGAAEPGARCAELERAQRRLLAAQRLLRRRHLLERLLLRGLLDERHRRRLRLLLFGLPPRRRRHDVLVALGRPHLGVHRRPAVAVVRRRRGFLDAGGRFDLRATRAPAVVVGRQARPAERRRVAADVVAPERRRPPAGHLVAHLDPRRLGAGGIPRPSRAPCRASRGHSCGYDARAAAARAARGILRREGFAPCHAGCLRAGAVTRDIADLASSRAALRWRAADATSDGRPPAQSCADLTPNPPPILRTRATSPRPS